MRLTPNGASCAPWSPCLRVEQLGAHRSQAITPNPPAFEMRGEVALADPAHRAAHDRDLAAQELGAAVHQLLEPCMADGGVDRAGFGDQAFAHAACSASRPNAVCRTHGELRGILRQQD